VNFSETPQLVIINGRFQGPPDSGNGGYSCAMIGQFIDGPAAVRLRIPPPLDIPMEVRKNEGRVELYHQGELAVSIKGSISAGEKCVLIGWEISRQGRRHYTGTALFGESGTCRATGYATWFEVPNKD
jgi:hypothetical protein